MAKIHKKTEEEDWTGLLQCSRKQLPPATRQVMIDATKEIMLKQKQVYSQQHNKGASYLARKDYPTMSDTLGYVNPQLLTLWKDTFQMDIIPVIMMIQQHKSMALMRMIQTLRKKVGAWVSTSLEAC